ncbi:MAG TPA: MarR family winged helix-turn-helix transcriptional regulator [Acidimicrobiales bacterium]|jgi:DNA-binding MarR family transcriptional regulator|nr:MarR family winged helix-turn-helix transcriptional regulator [Acidimicrobiales bacterium]
MGTATISAKGGDQDRGEVRPDPGADAGQPGGTCGVLGQMDDDRIRLMGLIVRTHRRLTDSLGRELEENVGIPLVFFDVLINVGGAPDRRLTMSRLSADVALTTGGVTRLVDRMAEAGLVARENCPSDRRSIYVVLTPQGQAVLDRAVAEHIEGIDRHLVAHLSDGDRAALEGALTKVLDAGC